jgi:hypothetical protein
MSGKQHTKLRNGQLPGYYRPDGRFAALIQNNLSQFMVAVIHPPCFDVMQIVRISGISVCGELGSGRPEDRMTTRFEKETHD